MAVIKNKEKVGKDTLNAIKRIFPVGAQVESINVKGIKSGLKGEVQGVKANGRISVMWVNGEITDVEFGNESIKCVADGICMIHEKCDAKNCSSCGWNSKVAQKRREQIERGEMKKGQDGIMRLVVRTSAESSAAEI